MNLLLLQDHHFVADDHLRLGPEYATHLLSVLQCKPGDKVTVGRLNGKIGEAEVTELAPNAVELRLLTLDREPPPQLPVTLVLALPRPRMLHRSLQTIATMGIERLCLIQSNRVEKSYWQTPLLEPDVVHQQLVTGLEQAKATQLPLVTVHHRFRPFVEDELPGLSAGKSRLVAHPGDYPPCPHQPQTPAVLAVGPEGGFVPHEIELLKEAGFSPVQLGQRILRVETAIPVLLSCLFY